MITRWRYITSSKIVLCHNCGPKIITRKKKIVLDYFLAEGRKNIAISLKKLQFNKHSAQEINCCRNFFCFKLWLYFVALYFWKKNSITNMKQKYGKMIKVEVFFFLQIKFHKIVVENGNLILFYNSTRWLQYFSLFP